MDIIQQQKMEEFRLGNNQSTQKQIVFSDQLKSSIEVTPYKENPSLDKGLHSEQLSWYKSPNKKLTFTQYRSDQQPNKVQNNAFEESPKQIISEQDSQELFNFDLYCFTPETVTETKQQPKKEVCTRQFEINQNQVNKEEWNTHIARQSTNGAHFLRQIPSLNASCFEPEITGKTTTLEFEFNSNQQSELKSSLRQKKIEKSKMREIQRLVSELDLQSEDKVNNISLWKSQDQAIQNINMISSRISQHIKSNNLLSKNNLLPQYVKELNEETNNMINYHLQSLASCENLDQLNQNKKLGEEESETINQLLNQQKHLIEQITKQSNILRNELEVKDDLLVQNETFKQQISKLLEKLTNGCEKKKTTVQSRRNSFR